VENGSFCEFHFNTADGMDDVRAQFSQLMAGVLERQGCGLRGGAAGENNATDGGVQSVSDNMMSFTRSLGTLGESSLSRKAHRTNFLTNRKKAISSYID
jgi:hypothetical protein